MLKDGADIYKVGIETNYNTMQYISRCCIINTEQKI